MAIIKCKHCGTDIEASEQGLLVCEDCGGLQTAPVMNNAKKIQFFNLATRLRLARDYDKGLQMYTKLAEQFDEVEPYYGKVLCKYGVQYVGEDVVCEIDNPTPVTDDEDFQHACDIATDDEFELLETEATLIDDYQQKSKAKSAASAKALAAKEAREKAEKEAQEAETAKKEKEFRQFYQEASSFDIFVLVNDKDRKTEIYQLAKVMRDVLKDDGKSVFFPHTDLKGLEDGDPKKEAYLQKALETAKLMLLFAEKKEDVKFYKVKDRLDSYVDLMANDNTKVLVPCFNNLPADAVPESIKKIKAIDLSKESFIDDVMDAVDQIFKVKVEPLKPEEKYYGKAVSALEKEDYATAIKNIDLCIKSNSRFQDAYRVAILASLNVNSDDKVTTPINDNKYFKMALDEGDTSVNALADKVNAIIYKKAVAMPHSTEEEVKAYVAALTPIKDYKDSQALIDSAYGPIYEPKYQEAIELLKKGMDQKFERFILEAVRNLTAIIPYKDSAEKAEEGNAFVEQLNDELFKANYDKAKDLYTAAQGMGEAYFDALKAYQEASKLFIRMLSYKDARTWNMKCKEMMYNYSAMVIFKSEEVAEVKYAKDVLASIKPYKEADTFINNADMKIKQLLDPKNAKKKKK